MDTQLFIRGSSGYGSKIIGALVLSWELLTHPVQALPIVTDGTTSTLVNGTTSCSGDCTITGSSIDAGGRNLFHSFQTFGIDPGATVTFIDPGVTNILTRVTGGSPSAIAGTLSVTGSANLFLLNPAGIQFSQGATLNLGGSFMASTADSLVFDNGQVFSATRPTPPSLLTVNTPLGLQFGPNPGGISVQQAELSVAPGQTLGLIGGELNLSSSALFASEGHVELGSVGSAGSVTFSDQNPGWAIAYADIAGFKPIQLTAGTLVDVSGPDAGSIQLQGSQIDLSDRAALLALVQAAGDGQITLNASQGIRMVGQADDPENPAPYNTGAQVLILPFATGNGNSQVMLNTPRLEVLGGAQVGITMLGEGASGRVVVQSPQINVEGGSEFFPSAIFTVVDSPFGNGQGGDLAIATDSLKVSNGAQLVASTFTTGNAGNFTINAKDILVQGSNPGGPSLLASSTNFVPSYEVSDSGRGGTLTITTQHLTVQNGGQVSTSTQSPTNSAGNLIIRASESVTLQGQDTFGRSGIFANAVSVRDELGTVISSRGAGGDIFLETNHLVLANGATINASNKPSNPNSPFTTLGLGGAGDVTIKANTMQLDNQSVITAETVDGDRGNIRIESNLITQRHNSLITTNATGTAFGGNIDLKTQFLVAVPSENSDITANSVNSFGGRVSITALGIFGIAPRTQLTELSDITATSALGFEFSGIVEINNPDVKPTQGLTDLSRSLIDPSTIVASACEQGIGNQFIVTGRGGLPDDATQPLRSQSVWQDLRLLGEFTHPAIAPDPSLSSAPGSVPSALTASTRIQEAQQIQRDQAGNLRLVAWQSSEPASPTWSVQTRCPAP